MRQIALVAATLAAFVSFGASAYNESSELNPYDGPRFDFRGQAPVATQRAPAKRTISQEQAKATPAVVNGFETIGGDAGWQLAQHRYVWINGAFAHSGECDHVVRTAAAAPTASELDRMRREYSGG